MATHVENKYLRKSVTLNYLIACVFTTFYEIISCAYIVGVRSYPERKIELLDAMEHQDPTSNYITSAELADFLGVSERTLSRWARSQIGPARTRIGRSVRYRRGTVLAWLESQEEQRPLPQDKAICS